MVGLPTGTVTFLFTDVEGSTQLLKRLGSAYGETLTEHEKILRSALEAHDGRLVDTQGDSHFFAFPRAKHAVAAAAEAQRRLVAHSWAHGEPVSVRMGMHTGEPRLGEQRYVGMGVHKAARIGAAGHGGQVLLSRATRELVEDELPPGVGLRDLGERRLKDLDQPERLFQLVIEGVPSDFGELRTIDVERRRMRRRLYASAALIALIAAAAAATIVIALGQRSGGVSVVANSVVIIDPRSNEIVGSVPVGVRPRAIALGAGSVWVANTEDHTVARIDPTSRRVIRTIPVGEYPGDISVSADFAWVALGATQQVKGIAVDRNEVGETLPAVEVATGTPLQLAVCPRSATSLTAGGGRLWLTCYNASDTAEASRIDPRRRRAMRISEALVSSSPILPQFSDVAFGLGSAWLVDRGANAVVQIEAVTLRRVREVPVGKEPGAAAFGFGWVWVVNTGDDSLSRFQISGRDPVASETMPVVSETIPVGDAPVDVAVGEGAVWVVNSGDRTISRIDPKTGKIVGAIRLEQTPARIVAGAGAVWVTVEE